MLDCIELIVATAVLYALLTAGLKVIALTIVLQLNDVTRRESDLRWLHALDLAADERLNAGCSTFSATGVVAPKVLLTYSVSLPDVVLQLVRLNQPAVSVICEFYHGQGTSGIHDDASYAAGKKRGRSRTDASANSPSQTPGSASYS